MKQLASTGLKSLMMVSALALIPSAYAQVAKTMKHTMVAPTVEENSKLSYFRKKLMPPVPITYANTEYRKKIVKLKWFDNDRPTEAFVNLSQSFDIYGLFEGGTDMLSPRAKAVLDDLGQAITSEGINTRMYALAAHTDASGRNSINQDLTTRRTKAVKAYLQDKFDIDGKRLLTVGFGSYNLKDKKNPTSKKNNRFEVCLVEDIYNHKPGATVQLPKNSLTNSRTDSRVSTSSAQSKDKMTSNIPHTMMKKHGEAQQHSMKKHAHTMTKKKRSSRKSQRHTSKRTHYKKSRPNYWRTTRNRRSYRNTSDRQYRQQRSYRSYRRRARASSCNR